MGMYTEINVCFDLYSETPKNVIDILKFLINGGDEYKGKLPNHVFFKCDRWDMVACCDSYYFHGSTNSKMIHDSISGSYKVNIRANLKNYDSEIEKFMDWLAPYIDTYGFIGYERYEEDDVPTLIFTEDDKAVFKRITVDETVTCEDIR